MVEEQKTSKLKAKRGGESSNSNIKDWRSKHSVIKLNKEKYWCKTPLGKGKHENITTNKKGSILFHDYCGKILKNFPA